MYPNSEILLNGVFHYAGEVPCDIRIFKHLMRYGSGDPFDDEDVRNDVEGEFYYIQYGSTSERGKYTSMSAAFLSLEEAIHEAEGKVQGTIEWES